MGCKLCTGGYFCLNEDGSVGKEEFADIDTVPTDMLSDCADLDIPSPNEHIPDHVNEGRYRRRVSIRNEILSTERNFVKHFEVMEKVFYHPLRDGGIVDSATVRDQFSDYLTIKGIHACLLCDLERGESSLAAIFDEFIPSLKMYKQYLQHFERRIQQRAQLIVTNAAFSHFLSAAQSNPLCRGQTVESLFVQPVQRIPRYKLLLHEYRSTYPVNSADHRQLTHTLDALDKLLSLNNEAIREHDRRLEMMRSMMRVVKQTNINVLDAPHRELLKEGSFLCKRHGQRGFKSLKIWLFSDKIVYRTYSLRSPGHTYDVTLSHCWALVKSIRRQSRQTDWSFLFCARSKCYILLPSSRDERDDWVQSISMAKCSASDYGSAGSVVVRSNTNDYWMCSLLTSCL